MVEVNLWFCPRCRLKWVYEPGDLEFCPRCRRNSGDYVPASFKCTARARRIQFFAASARGESAKFLCDSCSEAQHFTIILPDEKPTT